jgi:hypothetical protein
MLLFMILLPTVILTLQSAVLLVSMQRYMPPLIYPDALTPTQDKLEGFSAGGKFPFAYDSLGNITGITMG